MNVQAGDPLLTFKNKSHYWSAAATQAVDGTLLKQLHLHAITVSSIEAFQKLLSERLQADADQVDS